MKQLQFPQMGLSMTEYINLAKEGRVTRKAKQKYLSGEVNIGSKPNKKSKKQDNESQQSNQIPFIKTSTFVCKEPNNNIKSIKLNSLPKHCLPNYMKALEVFSDRIEIETTKLILNNRKSQDWIVQSFGDRTKLLRQTQKLIGLQQPSYYELDYKSFCQLFEKQVGQLSQTDRRIIFDEFKLKEDDVIYWPVGIFQPLNFDNIQSIEGQIESIRCRDDRVMINFTPKSPPKQTKEILQIQEVHKQQQQKQENHVHLQQDILNKQVRQQNIQQIQPPLNLNIQSIQPIQHNIQNGQQMVIQNPVQTHNEVSLVKVSMVEQLIPQVVECVESKNNVSQKLIQSRQVQIPVQSNNVSQRAVEQRSQHCQKQDDGMISKPLSVVNQQIPKFQTILNKLTIGISHPNKVLVWFTGTNIYKIISTDKLIHFNQIQPEQALRFYNETRLGSIKQQIREFVKSTNVSVTKHDRTDLKHDEKRFFTHRLVKKKNEQDDDNLYIVLRHKQTKQSKQVLILGLKEITTSWQNPDSLKVCYLLPKFTKKQLKILLILPFLQKDIREKQVLQFLMQSFYYSQSRFAPLINEYFTQQTLSTDIQSHCKKCYYRISNVFEKRIKCYFCNSTYHNDCDNQQRMLKFEDGGNQYWCCFNCVPCQVCFIRIDKEDLIQCITCKNHFHEKCGRNKNYSSNTFECDDCLKCDLCMKKLVNCSEECFVEGTNIYCQNCVKLIGKGDYCKVCKQKQQSKSQWTKCDKCTGWIHKQCDETLKGNFKHFTQTNIQYFCPFCRDLLKRSYFIQLINILIKFDDFGYFTHPVPQTLIDYKDIISQPMCFLQMIKRCENGIYDTNSFSSVKRDVDLIVANAMEYNMPKDHVHYSARVLHIMSIQFFNFFKDSFEISDKQLIDDKNISQSILEIEKKLFKFIYEHYLQIILNFGATKSHVNIKMKAIEPSNPPIFRSRQLLNLFKNCQVSITFKKDQSLIQHLFSLPKIFQPKKLPIIDPVCYYHNQPGIISTCQICLQSYCCIKQCILHHRCTHCGEMGCRCDSWGCGCPPGIVQKDLDHPNLKPYKHELLTITQVFKFCPKCAIQKIQSWKCKYCQNICTNAFSKCKQCQKMFHNVCNLQYTIKGMCYECQNLPNNYYKKKQCLQMQTITKLNRISRSQKLLPTFHKLYSQEGIRIPNIQLREMIIANYDKIQQYIDQIQLYDNNREQINSFEIFEQNSTNNNKVFETIFKKYKAQLNELEEFDITKIVFSQIYYIDNHQVSKYVLESQNLIKINSSNLLFINIDNCFSKFMASQFFKQNQSQMQQQYTFIDYLPVSIEYKMKHSIRQIRNCQILNKRKKDSTCLLFEEKKPPVSISQQKLKHKHSFNSKKLLTTKSLIKGLLIDIYNSMKVYSRTGSTCLIDLQKHKIQVYKKWNNKPGIWISLWREPKEWKFKVNETTIGLNNFQELLVEVRKLSGGQKSTINNLEDVARFLGFHIYQSESENYTYTKFLQTHPLQCGDRRSFVVKSFESLKINKVQKKNLFFLKKKSQNEEFVFETNKSPPPYFLFEELRRQLEDQPFVEKRDFKKCQPSRQIFIAPSTIHKLGLFAKKLQKKNSVLIEYMGQILSEPMSDLRQSLYHLGCYMFAIPKKLDQNIKTNEDATYDSSTPHINNSKRDVIDATFRGNQARYLNHSCDPNCASMIQQIDGSPRILIYAIRDIQPFQQLTYDYQFKVTAGEKIICSCKAKNCQGRLN